MLNILQHQPAPFDADPLQRRVDLPFQAIFHPMGHAVELSSNTADALDVATKLWWRYPVLSNAEPVRIRVISGASGVGVLREPSLPRCQGHLFSIVHGQQDFAIADLTAGFAFAYLSHDSISDSLYFRYYFLEPLAYVLQAARHFALVHASCISRNGRAIILCGDSGAGKTCLAYTCAKLGWDFVSGDALHIVRGRKDRMVIGRPYEIRFRETASQLFPELGSAVRQVRPNGKTDLELDTCGLNLPTVLHSAARHIVFIERSENAGIEMYPREHAVRRLEETICYGDDQTRSQQRDALAYFGRLPVWRLRYSDRSHAEHTLLSILDGEPSC
jgi:hypothetical protein